jgi:hypothetical protein
VCAALQGTRELAAGEKVRVTDYGTWDRTCPANQNQIMADQTVAELSVRLGW